MSQCYELWPLAMAIMAICYGQIPYFFLGGGHNQVVGGHLTKDKI